MAMVSLLRVLASGGPITDTFNRADSSTTINPASDGGTWTMLDLQVLPGNPLAVIPVHGIVSNESYVVTASGLHAGAFRDLGTVACDVTLTVSTTSYNRGVILLAVDPATGDCYTVEWWRSGWAVERWSGFTSTASYSMGSPFSISSGDTVRATYDGVDTIKIYVNGSLNQTIVDTTSPITGAGNTWVGYGASQAKSSTGETFNDFIAV